MVTKICCFDGKICSFASCDYLDSMGDVHVCFRHRNPSGRFSPKKVVS